MYLKITLIKIYYISLFIFLEIKKSLFFLIKLFDTISQVNLKSFLFSIYNDNQVKFKDSNINKFINKNKKESQKFNITSKKKILIELLLPHHLEPMVMNCLIGSNLSRYFGSNCVALIYKNDLVTQEIAKSFNIKEFIFIDQENFFVKFFYFLKSLFMISYNSIDKNLYNLKLNGLEIGKSSLEHYLRMYNLNPRNKNKFFLYLCLYKALVQARFAKKIFEIKYDYFVIAETQFIPNKLLFHQSLKSKIPVYTWRGTSVYGFTGRIFKHYNDRNKIILQYSKSLSKKLIKLFLRKDILKNLKKSGEIEKIGIETVWSDQKIKKILSFKNKIEFIKYFGLKKTKNVLILPHAMSDNLFNNNWNIFDTAYHWFYETLSEISKIRNVNWIIKPHPYEYKFKGVKARDIFNDFNLNSKNILFLSENTHIKKIYKYVDAVITGNGSAGYEYPSLGVPTITTSDAAYSNFDFTVAPKSKKAYFKILKKIESLKKVDKFKRKKAQIYWYSLLSLVNSHDVLPKIKHHGNFKKKLFFKLIANKNISRSKKNSLKEDIEYQLMNQNRHSINTYFFKKNKLNDEFSLKDI